MKNRLAVALLVLLCAGMSSCAFFQGATLTTACTYAKTACVAVNNLCGLLGDPNATYGQIQSAKAEVEAQTDLILQETNMRLMQLKKAGK